jgi:serine/threonine protein kinase
MTVRHLETLERFLLKADHEMSSLSDEASTLHLASGGVGIPRIEYFGSYKKWSVMIMDDCGSCLDEIFERSGRYFSMQTVLLLATQLLARLQFLHSRNIVHGNLCPRSFAVGRSYWQSHQVMMIDFKVTKDLQRTARDDLVDLGDILSYFTSGAMSWGDYRRRQAKSEPPFLARYKHMIKSSRSIDYEAIRNIFVSCYKAFVWHTGIALDLKGPRALKQSLTPNLGYLLTCDTATLRQVLSSRISIVRQQVSENSLPNNGCTILDTLDRLFEVYMAIFVRYQATDIERSMTDIGDMMGWIFNMNSQSFISFRLSLLNKFYGLFGVLLETLPSHHSSCIGYLSDIALLFSKTHTDTSSICLSLQAVTYWQSFRNTKDGLQVPSRFLGSGAGNYFLRFFERSIVFGCKSHSRFVGSDET